MPNEYLVKKPCYAMAKTGDTEFEITMYGEICENRPLDWSTGEPAEGSFILQDEFLEDLESLVSSGAKKVKIRMNSVGGDCGVSLLIYNRLRELEAQGVDITCVVDGVAMSGGSIIMCAANKVVVNPASLIMIHKCWSFLFGGYNADELREQAKRQDAWDAAQISVYKSKSKLSETVISHMMSETTYMTGAEAVEKGFADELAGEQALPIAASADRTKLYVGGRQMNLMKGVTAPDNIPTISTEPSEDINKPADNGENTKGEKPMAKNLTELREENAELAAEVEREVRAELSAENASALAQAVSNERKRLSEIDEIACHFDKDTVREAKYGEQACSAQEMSYRAAVKAAKAGTIFMANATEDTNESGVNGVQSAQAPAAEGEKKTEKQKEEEASATFKALLEGGNK